jgi:hypothetical protein
MFGKAVAINSGKKNESYDNNLRAKSTFLNAEYGDTNNYVGATHSKSSASQS